MEYGRNDETVDPIVSAFYSKTNPKAVSKDSVPRKYYKKPKMKYHEWIYSPENIRILNEDCPKCEYRYAGSFCYECYSYGKMYKRCAKRSTIKKHICIYIPSEKDSLIGEQFGKLTVIEKAGRNKHGHQLWRCRCECGKETVVSQPNLKSYNTMSCGCGQIASRYGQIKKGTPCISEEEKEI